MDMQDEIIESYKKSLRRQLDKVGNGNVPITNTLLWKWITETSYASGLANSLNSEINRANFARGILEMFPDLDQEKKREITARIRLAGADVEMMIDRGGMPESRFYSNPPVTGYEKSDRALITGTNVEVQSLNIYLKKRTGQSDDIPKILLNRDRDVRMPNDLLARLKEAKVNYSSQVGSFWGDFFGEDDFLDKPVSVPNLMIATGFMRNYNMSGGETMNVKDRLEEIAEMYKVGIEFIPSFCI